MMRYSDARENSAEVRMKLRDSREFATTVELDREIVCVLIDRGSEKTRGERTRERRNERMGERENKRMRE